MDSQDHVLNILRLFDSESLTISKFLQVLLSSRQYADHPLVVDLVQSHSHTISLFCLHGAFEGPALQWVHESAEKQYQSEIQELVKMKNGWQFNALHASAEQIEMFQIEVMAEKMESLAPHLWVLLDKLLSATGTGESKNRAAAGTGCEILQETDDADYWDSFDEIDLQGVIEEFGDIPQTHEQKRLARRKAIISIVWKLLSE
ncbi:hypothetical protein L208DRAFT_1374386 [Tricholoma matsutake]|nr:hypothetical protein L208DRAFT_1374386 [Tricholoma matsutake 945]